MWLYEGGVLYILLPNLNAGIWSVFICVAVNYVDIGELGIFTFFFLSDSIYESDGFLRLTLKILLI